MEKSQSLNVMELNRSCSVTFNDFVKYSDEDLESFVDSRDSLAIRQLQGSAKRPSILSNASFLSIQSIGGICKPFFFIIISIVIFIIGLLIGIHVTSIIFCDIVSKSLSLRFKMNPFITRSQRISAKEERKWIRSG